MEIFKNGCVVEDNLEIDLVEWYNTTKEAIEVFLQDVRNDKEYDPYDSLNLHDKVIVDGLVEKEINIASATEPEVTIDLLSLIEKDDNICRLESFEERIKTRKSLRRKIIAYSKDFAGSYEDAMVTKVFDSLRYTFIIDDRNYTIKIDEYLSRLEQLGYQVYRFQNTWDTEFYKGVNVKLYCRDGSSKLELQFHTQYGHQIKEGNTRDLYTVVKHGKTPDKLRKDANSLRKILQSKVPIPVGIIGYQYESFYKGVKK